MAKWNTPEDKHIDYLETRYMYEKRQKVYIANEETNQTWDETDIPDVVKAWNNNWSLSEIGEYLGADQWELLLLMADLLKQGKIQGNIHIFKPKNRRGPDLMNVTVEGTKIRVVVINKEIWLCVKDVWKYTERPEGSHREATKSWGPDQRAKFQVETDGGGRQHLIFINMSGLSRLLQLSSKRLRNSENEKLLTLKGMLENGLGIQSGVEGITDQKQSKNKKTKRSGRISRQDKKKDR